MAWLYQAQTSTKGIQLGNEEWSHTLAIGNNWTKIRVGGRFAVPAVQSFDGSALGTFIIGMCRGTSDVYKSPNCVDFLGFRLGNPSVPQYTYAASPGPHVFNGRPEFVSKVGTSATVHSAFSANEYFSALNSVRTQCFVDITKNAYPSFTMSVFIPANTTQGTTDNGYAGFISNMENNTTPTNCGTIGPLTFNHTGSGLLDTIYIGWNRSTPPITVFDFCACRVQ